MLWTPISPSRDKFISISLLLRGARTSFLSTRSIAILKKSGGQRGLSNSEIALVAALWGARQKGADIDHIPLADHFPASGETVDLDGLKAAIRRADAVLLATPVYFGDRGSVAQRFVELLRSDESLNREVQGKLYAGIAVGAKRNGGQETTLIYAMLDMINVGLLAVGNDSDTTSQYGGTVHAGDIGTAPKDKYGIDTSIGTGRRIANVAIEAKAAQHAKLEDLPRMDFWLLQDKDGVGRRFVEQTLNSLAGRAETRCQGFDRRDHPAVHRLRYLSHARRAGRGISLHHSSARRRNREIAQRTAVAGYHRADDVFAARPNWARLGLSTVHGAHALLCGAGTTCSRIDWWRRWC